MSVSISWHYTAFSVLAGVGAGYLLGLISSKWLWREHRRAQMDHSQLAAAITELTSEIVRLRESIERGGLERASRRSMQTADSVSDFVSAQGDNPDSDEEAFYDITTPNNNEETEETLGEQRGWDQLLATLDDLGKRTLESEEVCNDLIEQLNTQLEEHPDDVGLLWRLSRALVHLSMHHQQKGDTEGEKQLLQQATEHAQKALDIDTSVWQSHQWYAVAVGSSSRYEGTQQKIKKGHEYKEHIEVAISLHSSEPTLHYLKGRWCFEVAGLSWLEKTAASALFATPPESTYEEALECFMKVEELTPDQWKANILMVAKCWIQLGDIPTAVEWLHKAFKLPTVTSEDETSQKEIQDLLAQHDNM